MSKPRHQPSPAALGLIKRFEGLRERAEPLPGGGWIIGHSHTRSAREGASVSGEDAEALLVYDLRAVTEALDEAVFTPLSQNQVDALTCFVFSIGAEAFRRSAVLRRINEGALLDAAHAMEDWREAEFGGERSSLDALVRRRAAEKAWFLKPDEGWIAAASPLLRPIAQDVPDPPEAADACDELSPPQEAAAKLAARLNMIAPGPSGPPEPPPEPAPRAPVAPAEVASEPQSDVRPFPAPPAAKPRPAPEPPPRPRPTPDGEALRRSIYGEPAARPKADLRGAWRHAALAVAGLILFCGALFGAFHMHSDGGVRSPVGIGLVVAGLVGVACVAGAVYLFLARLGGASGQGD